MVTQTQFDIDTYNPHNIVLYAHQRLTAKFILKYKRVFILDDIGTGKTMSALTACDFLMLHKKISRVLIVSPISVMRATWCKHIFRYFPGRRYTVLHGSKAKRIANLALDADFYIINTDGIKIMENELIRKKFDMIIIDECTSYSRHTSDRTKCAWRLCQKITGAVMMTGNPIPNDTIQSYAQAKLLTPDYPKYFTKFRDQLKIKIDMYTYEDRDCAVDLAFSILRPSIRHKLEECIDLPPITFEYRDTVLSDEQQSMYKSMEKEYITWLQSGEVITAANAAVKGLKLLQISAGIALNKDGAYRVDCKSRIDELKIIKSQRNKLIVFASFTEAIQLILDSFPGSEKIDGNVSANKRYDIIQRFQEGDLDMIVCQPAAISHGVTLVASDMIVWWNPPYSNEHFIQCNGRIRRPGQTRPQLILMFRATKIEKLRYKSLQNKQSTSETLLTLEQQYLQEDFD